MYTDEQWKAAVRRLSHALFLADYTKNYPSGDRDHRKEAWSDNRSQFNTHAKLVLKELFVYNYILCEEAEAQDLYEAPPEASDSARNKKIFRSG